MFVAFHRFLLLLVGLGTTFCSILDAFNQFYWLLVTESELEKNRCSVRSSKSMLKVQQSTFNYF